VLMNFLTTCNLGLAWNDELESAHLWNKKKRKFGMATQIATKWKIPINQWFLIDISPAAVHTGRKLASS